jgi:hypothetical protein
MLGETFEFDMKEKKVKFIGEKVSHHPPIMACHAIGEKFVWFQDSHVKTKFWGKSMELMNLGNVQLLFPGLNEHYIWPKGCIF